MNAEAIKIFSLGENAVTIELANEISENLNDRVLSIASHIKAGPFPGFVEVVPAYSSLTIFFDLYRVKKAFPESPTAFDTVRSFAAEAIQKAPPARNDDFRTIEIPVCFDDTSGPDLKTLAEVHGLTPQQAVEIFTGRTYRVFMLGFLPGFAYMGEVDERVATPRRPTPRASVPKGSVGIAGRQTGIYPFTSPGGWQIIGRTATELFIPDDDTPCYFRAGDRVKFYPVERFE
jgi:inhibitor of KinA